MKLYASLLLLTILGITTACQQPQPEVETVFHEDPLIAVAHGVFMDADGREVVPDRAFIAGAQRYYITTILAEHERGDTRERVAGGLISESISSSAGLIWWPTARACAPTAMPARIRSSCTPIAAPLPV